MSDMACSVIEEYTNNIVFGATEEGDFYIVTHHHDHMNSLTQRLQQLGYKCSHTDTHPTNNDWRVTCFKSTNI